MSEPDAVPDSSPAGPEVAAPSGNGVHESSAPPAEPESLHAEDTRPPSSRTHFFSPEKRPEPVDGPRNSATPPPLPEPDDAKLAALEDRVRRLEDVLASLQLIEPVPRDQPAAAGDPPAEDTRIQAAEQVLGVKQKDPPTALGVLPPMPTMTTARRTWLLHDIYADLRAILRMFVDPRYRLMWQTKLFLPIVIAAMLFSWFVISAIPVIGPLTDRGLQLVMAFVLFKVLIREATRYRETSPDLPPSLRL